MDRASPTAIGRLGAYELRAFWQFVVSLLGSHGKVGQDFEALLNQAIL
jgi:hypothetical protein